MDYPMRIALSARVESNSCILCARKIEERVKFRLVNHNLLGPVKVCIHHPVREDDDSAIQSGI